MLFKNGIIQRKSKLNIKINGNEMIHFREISEIINIGGATNRVRFNIILNNNKKILQFCDSLEEFNLILNTYHKYKERT